MQQCDVSQTMATLIALQVLRAGVRRRQHCCTPYIPAMHPASTCTTPAACMEVLYKTCMPARTQRFSGHAIRSTSCDMADRPAASNAVTGCNATKMIQPWPIHNAINGSNQSPGRTSIAGRRERGKEGMLLLGERQKQMAYRRHQPHTHRGQRLQ